MSNFKNLSQKIGATKLAKFLNVTPEMVFKSVRKGYAPSDWYNKLVGVSGGLVTYEQLYTDLYLNKHNCKPEVVKKQVSIFLEENPHLKEVA